MRAASYSPTESFFGKGEEFWISPVVGRQVKGDRPSQGLPLVWIQASLAVSEQTSFPHLFCDFRHFKGPVRTQPGPRPS